MTTQTQSVSPAPRGERQRTSFHVLLLAAAMAAVAVLIMAPEMLTEPATAVPGSRWFLLLPLFALAEVAVIHLPTHRNAHGHTLREIPAVLGLTFLVPQQYVTAYVVGSVLALAVAARMRGTKLAFNAAMFSLEAALGALTYHAILQGGDPLSLTGWLAVLAAVLVTDLVSAAAVTAAISLTEGLLDTEVLREALRSGLVAAFINTCVALLVATLVLVRPSALPLLGVVVVLLVLGYRVYITLVREHARTRLLYQFVDRTSSASSLEEVIEVIVAEAAHLMHAERAYVVEVVDDHHVRYHAAEAGVLRAASLDLPDRPWWWAARDAGVVRHDMPHDRSREESSAADEPSLTSVPRDGLAAALRGAGDHRYVLVVCDRSFERETFGDEDVQVFEALAAHAGIAVEQARSVRSLETLTQELEVARDAALAASEVKSMFVANMSHEIRTPLTTVLITGEMLDATPLTEEQADLLGRMHRSGRHLLSLVESLLDFSRIETGRAALHHEEFDLHAVVSEIIDAQLPHAQEAGLALACIVDPFVPRVVSGDRTRLIQVLTNLVDNAIKFTPDGSVTVDVRAVSDDTGDHVQVEVSDTGIGIDAKDQETIFEAFRQVDGSTTRRYEGTGLGLAICKQLMELMGGTIGVAGEPGTGSTFTVRLPLAAAGPAADVGGVERRP